MNLLPALNPTVRLWDIPLEGEEVSPYFEYTPNLGTVIRDWIPYGCGRALVVVNGRALMQCEWVRPVLPGDVIDWHLLPCGGDNGNKGTSRQVLTIVAAIAIAYFTAGFDGGATTKAFLAVALNLAAQVLINALIPINPVVVQDNSPASVYNAALSANQARIYQPIPVIYGRMRTFPDFAAQPYSYYVDNDQYYAAVFCVGHGNYSFEKVQIDDTSLKSLNDAVYYKVLAPGVLPVRAKANVVTAPEVTGQELKAGKFVGGYTLSGAGYPCSRFEIDIVAANGQGYAESDGSITPFEIIFIVGCRPIDDFGAASGSWVNLGAPISLIRNTRTPQRITYGFNLPSPGRYEIRVVRTTIFYDDDRHVNTINWAGLRGFLTQSAPLNANATHLEVVMKATDQLSGLNQRKFNVVVRRKLRRWAPGAGWQPEAESRSLADAIADVLTNTVYGSKLKENEVDLDGLAELRLIWEARQDRFDAMFDSRQSVRDVLNTLGQAGRSKIYQRNGVYTAARDQIQDLPATAYTSRNILPGTAKIGYALATPETADQVIIEYFDNKQWDWVPIKCNAPGVVTAVNPVTIRVNGITGYKQALREGTYMAAANLRRKFPSWQVEMDGLLPTYGSAVVFAPAMPGWGQSGDVTDVAGLTLSLSEPPVFLAGSNHYISLVKRNGGLSPAIRVLPGPTPFDVVLAQSPGFTPITNDSQVERTRYIFGPEGKNRSIVRLLYAEYKGRSPSGSPMMELGGVEENNLVHTVDNAYLPAGGVIQDPVPAYTVGDSDTPSTGGGETGGSGGSYFYIVQISNRRIGGGSFDTYANLGTNVDFRNNGFLTLGESPGSVDVANEWMRFGAVEVSVASRYEVRATLVNELIVTVNGTGFELTEPTLPTGAFNFYAGTFGTWQNLSVNRRWHFLLISNSLADNGERITSKYAKIRFEIREAASSVVQATALIELDYYYIL